MKKNLLTKLANKKAIVGIIGLGYVGIPLMLRFSDAKYKVIGFDIDCIKVKKINKRESYIHHIPSKELKSKINKKSYATTNFADVNKLDIIIICVPTPLNKKREPDLSYIDNVLNSITPYLKRGQMLSLESTTYPGTTEEKILPKIEKNSLITGKDFFLVYSPEREDPGNKKFNTKNIPKVIGGHTKNCLDVGCEVYGSVIDKVIPVSSTKTAEMTKLLENIYRSVNIGLVNEMKIIADKLGIDIHEVISAASTKPFGFTPYFPGPGLGGHCIPIDPFYLSWKAKKEGLQTKFIELSSSINRNMPIWVCNKIIGSLKEKKINPKNAKILLLGISYKKDIDDIRESPAIQIINILEKKVKKIDYSDPYIPKYNSIKKNNRIMQSINLSKKNIERYDLVALITNHSKFDYSLIYNYSKILVDTRGVFSDKNRTIVKA